MKSFGTFGTFGQVQELVADLTGLPAGQIDVYVDNHVSEEEIEEGLELLDRHTMEPVTTIIGGQRMAFKTGNTGNGRYWLKMYAHDE